MFYSYVASPLGPIFLAGDGQAVHRISFTRGHQIRFAEHDWRRSGSAMEEPARELQEYFAGERQSFEFEVHLSGTDFQNQVWRILQQIPFGETRSYGEVAQELGRPSAARAVGRANATNCLPLVVPCHRVIGSNGSLTGFGGGIDTKEWLLRFEGSWEDKRHVQPSLF